MNASSILRELQAMGRPGVRKVLLNHGVGEPCYGVRIGDLKPIQKRIKVNHELALALWDSGVHDARYLAGLIAEDARMSVADLDRWAEQASDMLAGTVVPWVAAGSRHGIDRARHWIDSDRPNVAAAGWVTWAALAALTPDDALDLPEWRRLLDRLRRTIHDAPNRVRYQMNHCLIAIGCHVAPLLEAALAAAEAIGPVAVDLGATACEVPYAPDYIRKVEAMGRIGKKRKTVKC